MNVHWIPWAALVGAVVIALVVFGFCAYELVGGSRRLRREMQRLDVATGRLRTLRDDLQAAQQRAASSGF